MHKHNAWKRPLNPGLDDRTGLRAGGSHEIRVVSHPGTSQYSSKGSSACGLICMNWCRLVIQCFQAGQRGEMLLCHILTSAFVEVRYATIFFRGKRVDYVQSLNDAIGGCGYLCQLDQYEAPRG